MPKPVVLYGEMLWDCLPTGAVPGGAPMNVALHLHQLGRPTQLISAVGKDPEGEALLDFLRSFDLPLDLVQVKEGQATSQVVVDTSDPENIRYDILKPVAWDFLSWSPQQDRIVAESDALVFGTLGARHPESLTTLLKLLRHPTLRIFDANLRPPHYSFSVIETLLGYTDILKINEDELVEFANHFGTEATISSLCDYLNAQYPISIICITRGSKGAAIYRKGTLVEHPGYKVAFQDSIGAGDAFLSGFIKMYLAEKSPEEIIDFACKLGGYVATQKGGAPRYTELDVHREIR
jgi:fructokinase